MNDQEMLAAAETMLENAGFGVSSKTMQPTSETLGDFARQQADKHRVDRDIAVPHMIWDDVQFNGKGTPRGTLAVLDFGACRVVNFC